MSRPYRPAELIREITAPETERAWAAGIFDGEGHSRRFKASLRMVVGQRERTLLERFQKAVESGAITQRHDGCWVWGVYAKDDVLFTILTLWPYLHITKRQQFREAANEYFDLYGREWARDIHPFHDDYDEKVPSTIQV